MSGLILSREQEEAAFSDADHLVIVAPPGCGKTEVLAHRAAHLVDFLEKNQRILALTFTNRARANLEERLRDAMGQKQARRYIVVRNFHGFATQIVLAHGRTIGLKMEDLRLPKTNTLRRAMAEAGGGSEKYDAERILGDIKRHALSDAEVLAALRQLPQCDARELAERVERSRQDANQLHYDDLLRHAQCLLHIPAVARLYQAHFGALLIDEYQDLSLQQLDFARLSCTSRQTYAGDPLQGIYSWAGASPSEVEAEIHQHCAQLIRLRESYRSSPKVLEAVNSISEQIDPESGLVSAQPEQWAEGGCSAKLVLQNCAQEAEVLLNLVGKILSRDPSASVGVICRSKWRREDIDRAFGKESRYQVRRWELAIEDPRIAALIQSAVATLPRGASIEDARSAVCELLDPADVEMLEQVDDAFDTLGESGVNTARDAIQSIRAMDSGQSIGPGVHLLNAHTGKGQQFDWVFVVGLEEGHLPDRRNSTGDPLAEEQRALLVMLSRARQGLVVTRVRVRRGKYGSQSASASRWWSDLQTSFTSAEEVERFVSTNLAAVS